MALIVQKYGGTSVGDVDRIRNVARRAAATREKGNGVIVVVSAMAGETDGLIRLAHEVTERPAERELDVIMASGEQQSSALLAMAIVSMGVPARSFLGHQIPIHTDGAFTRAGITGIEGGALLRTVDSGAIAVVAGFQGIDEHGNITTLGRGGSDTSAVAIAAAVKADACEIYTDVDGVFTTDPNIAPAARKLNRISYEEMLEMASLGAKVLQTRSVLFAMKYKVPVVVRSSFHDQPGTLVTEEDGSMEDLLVTGITYNNDEARITVEGVPDQPGVADKLFTPISDIGVNVDMIIQNASRDGVTDMTFTVPKKDLDKTMAAVEQVVGTLGARGHSADSDVSKISVIGVGMRAHTGIAARVFRTLSREGINIHMVSTSEIKISCLIRSKYVELAVRALHSEFGLDDDSLPRETTVPETR